MTEGPSEEEVSVALGDLARSPAVWAVRPHLRTLASSAPPARRRLAHAGRLVTPLRVGRYRWVLGSDGVLFAWTTVNQRRAMGRAVAEAPLRGRSPGPWLAAQRAPRATRAVVRDAIDALRPLAADVAVLAERLVRAEAEIRYVRMLLERTRPVALVVATQHSVTIRAMLVAARELGIPSVYVPHAPFAANPLYADLPFDRAALRGQRERLAYGALGARTEQIEICGALSVPSECEAPVGGTEVVVAPSPWDTATTERFFDLVRGAALEEVVVCPHPRSDVALLERLAPTGARVLRHERAVDRLRARGGILLQHSSGVALEGLLTGVPVIEVTLGRSAPNYPLIAEPHVDFVDDAADLQRCVVRRRGDPAPAHERRRAWAREWCAWTGVEAEQRFHEALHEVPFASQRVLDGWGPDTVGPMILG